MSNFFDLLSIAVAFSIVTVSPGPANIALATVAMGSGRKQGLLFGAGLGVGLAFWGLVAATGMGAILQASEVLLTGLKIMGGLYLLWLALQSARSAMRTTPAHVEKPLAGRWFAKGLILNLSNPKAVVAWMAALSMGLGEGDFAIQLVIATLICIALGFLNYLGHAFAFSLSGPMTAYQNVRRWIDGLVSALFAVAGFGLIKSAFAR